MIEHISKIAEFSVARGCGFALLAIFTTVAGLSFDMPMALKTGAILLLLTSMVLVLKAIVADRTPFRRTETWILLAPQDRPSEAIAQQVIAGVLRETYLRFALYSAAGGGMMLVLVIALALIGSRDVG